MSRIYGTVCHTEPLSPTMQRVVFDGDGLSDFSPIDASDQYVNALFPPEGAGYEAPFDVEAIATADMRPRGRRYTVRHWDTERRRLTIDFVVHGDVGLAGRWARRAAVGDRLQLVGPHGSYRPDPTATWHLMIGDESALPAIAATLEVVTPDVPCVVIALIDGASHEIDLPVTTSTHLRWVHRSTADDPETALLDAVVSLDWLPGSADVFVHGEAAEVRAVRRFLLAERGVTKQDSSISPYWRRDCTDEAWREIKQRWLAEQDLDVTGDEQSDRRDGNRVARTGSRDR